MSQTRNLASQTESPDACCSFCREPLIKVGPLIEGPETEGASIYICRQCAELAIEILDDEERRRRAEKPVGLKKVTLELIEICAKALDHFESLSRQRELTEIELERKQRVVSELERLRSEN